jgi:hypothetical protein
LRGVSGGAIVLIVVGVVIAFAIPIRIAVAKHRRMVETARARLAAARNVRRRAEGVAIDVIQFVGNSPARVSRTATCALTDDGFYCLGDDGRWGARVRLEPGAPELGDVTLSTAPCLIRGGTVVGNVEDRLLPMLASMPPEGLVLQFGGGLSWMVALPSAEEWFGLMMLILGKAGATAQA